MRALAIPSLIALFAACPSPKAGNPDVLWLAPGDASETTVQLIDHEPGEF